MAQPRDLRQRRQLIVGGGQRSRIRANLRWTHQIVGWRGRRSTRASCSRPSRGCQRREFRDRNLPVKLHGPPRSSGKKRRHGDQAHHHADSGVRTGGIRWSAQKRCRQHRIRRRCLFGRRFFCRCLGDLKGSSNFDNGILGRRGLAWPAIPRPRSPPATEFSDPDLRA